MAEGNGKTFVPVYDSAKLGNGDVRLAKAGERDILLARWKGDVYALSAYCPHNGGLLEEGRLVDGEVECPRHGARFDVRTGKALTFPAVEDISAYPVRIDNGKLLVGLPKS